jgi:histidinol-phosphate aminotransferase
VLAIEPYVPGKSAAPGAPRVFKLSANESPIGPSPKAVQALHKAALDIAFYPDGSSTRLREAIGARWGLDPAGVIVGAGADEILALLAYAYIGFGDEGVYSQYGFLEYKILILAAGGTPVVAPETNYTANVDALLKSVTPRTKVVFLANPNNPTGTLLPAAEIARLVRELPPNVLLVLDAAYAEYVRREDYEAGAALVREYDNVVMTRTFSKIFGLAGLRVGWAYAPACVVDALNRIRPPFNVSSAASAAAIAALEDREHFDVAIEHNARWLPWLVREISALGLEILPSEGNFLAIHFPRKLGRSADEADRFLAERGFVLRSVSAYGMPDFLRLTVGSQEANELVVGALAAFLTAQAHEGDKKLHPSSL